MMKQSLPLVALLSISAVANASTTICKGNGALGSIKSLAWDTQTKSAKVSPSTHDQLSGRVTLVRPHNNGFKVNIIVEHEKRRFGADVTEYMIFSMPGFGQYRLLSVSYVVEDGERHVTMAEPSEDVTCETL